jgi:hypothetical protein
MNHLRSRNDREHFSESIEGFGFISIEITQELGEGLEEQKEGIVE